MTVADPTLARVKPSRGRAARERAAWAFVAPAMIAIGLFFAFPVIAALLLSPRWRPLAGWALIGVICAVSFANIHMWLHPELFPEAPRWVYTARLILQVGLIWCVWFGTRVPGRVTTTSAS